MFDSTKYFFNLLINNRLKAFIIATVIFVIFLTHHSTSKSYTDFFPNVPNIPEFCMVTHNVQLNRQRNNSSLIDPARQVVDELLEYVTYNKDACVVKKDGEYQVVILVNTARDHFRERQLIRRTWASLEKYKKWYIRTLFLMGQHEYCLNATAADKEKEDELYIEEEKLLEESRIYGDLVIGAFLDTYRNLTYKHFMGYKFVIENCPQTDFIVKTDDDIFVEVPAILDFRGNELEAKAVGNVTEIEDIYCHSYHDGPTRDPNGKWFSTKEEWPEDTYPPYCLGGANGISMEWLQKIYSVRHDGGFFWVDDVFIMGKLREIAEKKYNKTTNRMNMPGKGRVTDKRGEPDFVPKNCDNDQAEIGWFVLLERHKDEYVSNMECLWRRAVRIAKINAVLVSKSSLYNVT